MSQGQVFAIFSNTIEEYEAFIKFNVFYWPREISKLTPYQKKIPDIKTREEIGDKIAIVVGANLKGIKDDYLKDQIKDTPMITHFGEVVEVYDRPVLGYRYTHGKKPSPSLMLPFELLPQLKEMDEYLGKKFSKENIEEIEQAILLGNKINSLLASSDIKFTRAYFKKKCIYIDSEKEDEVYELTNGFPLHKKNDLEISNRLTYRLLPNRESLKKIVSECNAEGLDGENLILKLRTWRGTGFMKLNILEEKFIKISGKLQEGISTRLVSKYEDTDEMIMEINHKIQEDETINHYEKSGVDNMGTSKNTILYGPPGTGKTYSVIERAVQLINPVKYKELDKTENKRTQLVNEYKKLVREKRIQFCTFHQSYSYEDFIEGLRSDEDGKFVPTNGVFKDLCESATFGYSTIIKDFEGKSTKLFKMNFNKYLWQQCEENNCIKLNKENDLDFSKINSKEDISALIDAQSNTGLKDKSTQYVNRFINDASIGDYIFASIDGESIVGIGKIESEYYYEKDSNFPHTRKVRWFAIWEERETTLGLPSDKRAIIEIPFEQDPELYECILPSELFEEKNYLIIIDEINRGNISKIFGELITLIEEDKRLGKENEIKVTLPYSRELFSIPSNVYILGTMNTADRSIMLMDTALRRRFDFIEMLPAPEILVSNVEGVNVKRLLETINKRIEFLFDRDHQIGHAYFINKTTATEIIDVIKNKVLPLLQEYFYGEWEKIELVLGGAAAIGNDDYFIQKEVILAKNIFKSTIRKLPDQHVKYSIVESPSTQALINIYE